MKLPVVPEGLSTSRKGDRNMKDKQVKLPGPEHPISIQRNPARVVVSVAGRVVADSRNALTLREAAYPPVQYIPPEDVDFSQLERTDHVTYCPFKGEFLAKTLSWRGPIRRNDFPVDAFHLAALTLFR